MAIGVATPWKRSTRANGQRIAQRILTYLMLMFLALSFSLPFAWTFSSSLKTGIETHRVPPILVPEIPQWSNYLRVWTEQPIGQWLLNSATVILLSLPGALLTSTVVAYSFARFSYPGRDFLFMVVLSTMMLPNEVTLIPQYLLFQRLRWIDTFAPLIVPSWAGGGAFTIFLLRQFFLTIPRDFDDAAVVDGATSLHILWHIIVPLSQPAIITVAILHFLGQWNDFLGPFIYLNSQKRFTMAVGLRFFQTLPDDGMREPKGHLLMAATIIMSVPAIVLFFAAQRYFIRGVVMSGLKF